MGIQNGTSGTTGGFPDGNGGAGTAGGDAYAFHPAGNGLTGGNNPSGLGGSAGAGGAGGRARALRIASVLTGDATADLTTDGGGGGSAGAPGNVGTPNQGTSANDGNGDHALHGGVEAVICPRIAASVR